MFIEITEWERLVAEAAKVPQLMKLVESVGKENARLDGLINNPHIDEFLVAVKLEALHQRERWGAEHDAGKEDEAWLFLAGFLGGKAVQCGKVIEYKTELDGQGELNLPDPYWVRKRLHHIITMAAVCLNWHANRSGIDTRMRPGIEPPKDYDVG